MTSCRERPSVVIIHRTETTLRCQLERFLSELLILNRAVEMNCLYGGRRPTRQMPLQKQQYLLPHCSSLDQRSTNFTWSVPPALTCRSWHPGHQMQMVVPEERHRRISLTRC